MKRYIAIIAALVLFATPAASAATYIVPDGTCDTWVELYDDGTNTNISSVDPSPPLGWTRITGSTGTTVGWWNIGIGHEYAWNIDPLDVSAYDDIRITIRNQNPAGGDRFWFRAFVNAGWVGQDTLMRIEGTQPAGSGWLAPQKVFTSVIDLASLTYSQKQHITKIGVDVAMYADQQIWDPDGSYAGTGFNITVVPEPATFSLLALGGLGLLLRRGRR